MSKLNNLDLLLSRLADPSGLVRDLSCRSISTLLLNPELREKVETSLFQWMKEQKLESLAPLGVLAFLRAKLTNNSFEMPSFKMLKDAIEKPSVLSWIFLRECTDSFPLRLQNMHSSSAPDCYKAESIFEKYSRYGMRPFYAHNVEELEEMHDLPVEKQWSFEFNEIVKESQLKPSPDSFDYKGREDDEHFEVFDPLLNEICLSSYLRTLAWLISKGVSRRKIVNLVIEICPIDLGLWRLENSSRPKFWPKINTNEKDASANNQIWNQLNLLYRAQFTQETDWVIAKADGRVSESAEILDLNISGFFKASDGCLTPDISELINWLFFPYRIENTNYSLCFEGKIKPLSPKNWKQNFRDWIIYPAMWEITPKTALSWQFWRLSRGVYFPAPFILEKPGSFECKKDSLAIYEGPTIVGKWRDWTDGLTDRMTANLPPSTGNVLMIKRSIIERFEKKTNSEFCWGCCITRFCRSGRFERYNENYDYKLYVKEQVTT